MTPASPQHALILCHEIWGITPALQAEAATWRQPGFHVVVPSFYETVGLPAQAPGEEAAFDARAALWQCLGSAVMPLPADVVARWAPGGSVVEEVGPTRARLTVGAWSWAGIAGILATFDVPLEDVEPTELRQACRQLGIG